MESVPVSFSLEPGISAIRIAKPIENKVFTITINENGGVVRVRRPTRANSRPRISDNPTLRFSYHSVIYESVVGLLGLQVARNAKVYFP